ncbi:hypothetical protein K402DRAFT_26770 [Aulographum hederae CBS 113979]|uniref:Nephrocystin 3-like N-terminal domain-containing protein n=1 Tax=Aulographum hederae CBS 113979 TaxID=1176131 RepID=A0A6G1H695_9PEZI|nr:hypothetical protein K402DRAFT_26770 [Aulographum hederae CBS 113979]
MPFDSASSVAHVTVGNRMKFDNEIEECYQDLQFAQIYMRKELVKSAAGITFQWLLGQDETHPMNHQSPFLSWICSHLEESNVFLLSGKAGSVKSTLIKVLHDHPAFEGSLDHWMKSKGLSQLAVAGFYFYERGESVLQKSREGLLRALLYALLSQAPALKHVVFERMVTSGISQLTSVQSSRPGYYWKWADLQNALLSFMQHKPDNLGVYLFADGLDEYLSSEALEQGTTYDGDDNEMDQFNSAKSKGHREIADFFLKLSHYSNTKICLSSRPLPIFDNRLSRFPYLKLDELTKRDICLYASQTLQEANTSNGFGRLTAEELGYIVGLIVKAASGVFLWVEVVVEQLIDR